jgi:CHAT domain
VLADAPEDDTGLLLRTRLLEQYRRLRPDLGDRVGRIRPVAEIAPVLEPGEGVVILAAFDDMTAVSLVTPGEALFTMTLRAWPWWRWDSLLDGPGGWRHFLAGQPGTGQPGTTGHDALENLIQTVDRVLGESILDLIEQADGETRKIAIVPHRWLHLIPYWALPSLAPLPVSVFSSVDELVTSRASPPEAAADRGGVVVANPTRDLICSASETESVVRMARRTPLVLLAGGQATASAIAASLQNAAYFHFSGHAYSDHGDPDRSALLVAPAPETAADPFPAWDAAADWRPAADGWQTAEIPGTGRLYERTNPVTQEAERRMERGSAPTLFARYSGGRLRRLGELWSVGDILALGQQSPCRLAFLSACESGVAGGKSSYVDEYGGLPAALRLGGIDSLVCSLWELDEGFTALYADLFYQQLPTGRIDPVAVVRQVGRWLREARKPTVLQRLDGLADQVRKRSPRAAMALEAYRAKIDRERGDVPYSRPWEWASFYAVSGGTIDLEGVSLRKDTEDA